MIFDFLYDIYISMNNLYIIGLIVLVIIIFSLYACKNDNI